jgi:hypothetical protein
MQRRAPLISGACLQTPHNSCNISHVQHSLPGGMPPKLLLHYAAQNLSGDSFFLARAFFLGENLISRSSMRQSLCFLARKLYLDERNIA